MTCFPEDDTAVTRKPIPVDDIKKIQALCRSKDDNIRWLIVLISFTGIRLGEAAGLLKSGIRLGDSISHIDLRLHS
jgi:hypothetical protein